MAQRMVKAVLAVLLAGAMPAAAQIFPAKIRDKDDYRNFHYLYELVKKLNTGSAAGPYILKTDSFGGDVSGTYGALAVTNDSHAHTPATLSGVITSTAAIVAQLNAHQAFLTTATVQIDSLSAATSYLYLAASTAVYTVKDNVLFGTNTFTGGTVFQSSVTAYSTSVFNGASQFNYATQFTALTVFDDDVNFKNSVNLKSGSSMTIYDQGWALVNSDLPATTIWANPTGDMWVAHGITASTMNASNFYGVFPRIDLALSTAAFLVSSQTFTGTNRFLQALDAPRYMINGAVTLSTAVGGYSVVIGSAAGHNSTGDYNTYLGYNAGKYQSSGPNNTFIGYNTGYGGGFALPYSSNTVIGANAGSDIQGDGNILIGYNVNTPTTNTDDYLNIGGKFVGNLATSSGTWLGNFHANNIFAANLISSTEAIQAQLDYIDVALSTAGFLPSTQTWTGQNTFSNQVNISSDISCHAYQVNGSTVISIPNNDFTGVALGQHAGAIALGSYNIYLGYQAGKKTIGSYNAFIGYQAGQANTTGARNYFMGYQAGLQNTTGGYNTFLGALTGVTNTTGANNIYIGYGAGYTGNATDNVFIGREAGNKNTTSGNNTAIGHYSLYLPPLGWANTAIGYEAGRGVAANTFSSSTLVGFRAGYGLTTGVQNIFIGSQAGYAVTSGSGNIIIGYNKQGAATDTMQLNIGGLLVGDMNPATSSVTVLGDMYANHYYGDGSTLTGVIPSTATGSYGIRANQADYWLIQPNDVVAGPVYPLWVTGSPGYEGGYNSTGLTYYPATGILSATSYSGSGASLTGVITSTADIVASIDAVIISTGELKALIDGISSGDDFGSHIATKTVTMNYGLVGSSASFDGGAVTIGSSLTLRDVFYSTNNITALGANFTGGIRGYGSLVIDHAFNVGEDGATTTWPPGVVPPAMYISDNYNGQGIYADAWGYFGTTMTVIGYTDLKGTATVQGNAFSVGGSTLVVSNGRVLVGKTTPYSAAFDVTGNISNTGQIISSGTGSNYFAGKVGVGTAGPLATMEISTHTDSGIAWGSEGNLFESLAVSGRSLVLGKTVAGSAVLTTNSARDLAFGYYSGGNKEVLRIKGTGATAGNVGIGTTAPATPLHIVAANPYIKIAATSPTNWDGLGYVVNTTSAGIFLEGSVAETLYTGSLAYGLQIANDGNYPIQFLTNSTQRMIISNDGKVGIGATNPTSQLYVSSWTSSLGYIDRTDYPETLEEAYTSVKSAQKKVGDKGLDHTKLTSFVRHEARKEVFNEMTKSTDTVIEYGRNLTATVSAFNEVIKDLIKRIEALEEKP